MKKKVLAVLSLALVSMSLTSCDLGGGNSTTTGGDSTTTSVTSSNPDDILNNGYEVPVGIPNKNGDITSEKLSVLFATFWNKITGENVNPEQYVSSIEETFLPDMKIAGFTNADVDKVMDLIDESIINAIKKLTEETQNPEGFTPDDLKTYINENGDIYIEKLKAFLNVLGEEKSAAVIKIMFMSTAVTSYSIPNDILNGLTKRNMNRVINDEKAPEEVRTYFQTIVDHSNLDDRITGQVTMEMEALGWFIGRVAYRTLTYLLDNLTNQEIKDLANAVISMMFSSNGFAPTAETILPLANALGRVIEDGFMNVQSFSYMFSLIGQAIKAQSNITFGKGLGPHGLQTDATGLVAKTFEEIVHNARSYFTVLKFIGTLLKNANEEEFNAIMAFVDKMMGTTQTPSEDPELNDITSDIVRLAKMVSTNLTRFGSQSDQVLDSIKEAFEKLILPSNSSTFGHGYTTTEARISEVIVRFNPDVISQMADEIMDYAKLDPNNLTEADKEKINSTLALSQNLTIQEETSYSFTLKNNYGINSTVEPLEIQRKMHGETSTINYQLEGIDTSVPHIGKLVVEVSDTYRLAAGYTVTDFPNLNFGVVLGEGILNFDVYEDRLVFEVNQEDPSVKPEIEIEASYGGGEGQRLHYNTQDIINLDLTPGRSGFMYLPLGEDIHNPTEYYVQEYEVI